jgi:excisionase family DNA binding protein
MDLDPADLLAELQRRYGRAPSYPRVWRWAVEGRIPAHRVGPRWRFKPADVPAIAAALGLADHTTDAAA